MVFRNRLLEVIRYAPTTPTVAQVPLVMVTPWINKFYVLDLNAQKSMVRYLVAQGFTVFITSWKNPDASMRDVRFDDYLTEGVDTLVRVAREHCGVDKVHAAGYCIGGTALAIYMAWANRHYGGAEHNPVAHWTLLTSLVDFHRPGDIEVFIDEHSTNYLCRQMETRGYLDGREMASAFRLLRSNSLIWNYVVHGWLYGEEPPPFDVLYWNMDTTRLPYAMHSWYLRELYLNNKLIRKDALTLAGEAIDLEVIVQPLYAVAAEDDHIVPWREAYRICNFVMAAKRFVLTTRGTFWASSIRPCRRRGGAIAWTWRTGPRTPTPGWRARPPTRGAGGPTGSSICAPAAVPRSSPPPWRPAPARRWATPPAVTCWKPSRPFLRRLGANHVNLSISALAPAGSLRPRLCRGRSYIGR